MFGGADDLRSGTKLIDLLELMSGESVGRYIKHPRAPIQMIANISVALDFIEVLQEIQPHLCRSDQNAEE